MSTPYVIILSDSEDELDQTPVTIILSESDNENNDVLSANYILDFGDESDPSEFMEEEEHSTPEHVPENMEIEENLSEEDPSEAEPSNQEMEATTEETITPVPSPPTYQSNHTSGPRTIRTARKRVAIPQRRVTSSPESSIPTTDPYFDPTVPAREYAHYHVKNWTWLADALKEWREEEGFPTTTEVGESSTAVQENPYTKEPPHHTVPLLVARMSSQEQRIEHAENNIMEMPGREAFVDLSGDIHALGQNVEGLQERVTNLEQNFEDVGEATQEMIERGQEFNNRTRSLESRMARVEQEMTRIEGHIDRLSAMAAATREYEAMRMREDYLSKKD